MKTLITGHRLFKLQEYSIDYIKLAIEICVDDIFQEFGYFQGYSGMASGVDLWFCDYCLEKKHPYYACIPFEDQKYEMEEDESKHRDELIENASNVLSIRNSRMLEMCDMGIVVWDGNKGGTHNVLQQLVENMIPFKWINPVSEKIIEC